MDCVIVLSFRFLVGVLNLEVGCCCSCSELENSNFSGSLSVHHSRIGLPLGVGGGEEGGVSSNELGDNRRHTDHGIIELPRVTSLFFLRTQKKNILMKLLLQVWSPLLLAWCLKDAGVLSFSVSDVSTPFRTFQCQKSRSSTSLNVIFGPETALIAAFSAAAGAAARQPEINTLKTELTEAQKKVEESKAQVAKKIEELEEKLFEVDSSYEAESAKFQKEYEQRKQIEIASITEKIKTDMKFKLEIEIEKEKSRLLSEKLLKVKKESEESTEIAQLRMQQEKLQAAKDRLERALQLSEEKMKTIEAPKSKKFWPF